MSGIPEEKKMQLRNTGLDLAMTSPFVLVSKSQKEKKEKNFQKCNYSLFLMVLRKLERKQRLRSFSLSPIPW